jgi:flagella basal body P-ring formation protein FlgA
MLVNRRKQKASKQLTVPGIIMIVMIPSLFSTSVWANPAYHSHADIYHSVKQALTQHIRSNQYTDFRIQPGKLDPRLRLKKCDIPLETYITQNNRYSRGITVSVRCNGQQAWQIYVPSQVYVYKKVLVSKQTIARGQLIAKKDLMFSRREISNLHYGYFVNKHDIIGKQTTRTLFPGTVLRTKLIRDPIVVKRGETVTIVAEISGIKVSMSGKALNSGSKGKTIKVRNLSSKKVVEATIIDKGLVKVIL